MIFQRCRLVISILCMVACQEQKSTNILPSDTQILGHYLNKTFRETALTFNALPEINLFLVTGNGCSYCNQKVIDYLNNSQLDNTYAITSQTMGQSKLRPNENVLYDTIQKNLNRVNLRCNEGPVYLKLQQDSVVANLFITAQNVDSIFMAINP